MSNEAINAVLAAEIRPPALKLLALCMANYANKDTGLMWPGVGTLARDCSISHAHAKRLLRELREQQVILVAKEGGGNASSVYRFNPDRLCTGYIREPGTSVSPHPVHWCTGGGFTDEPGGGSLMNPEPKGTVGNPKEPSLEGAVPASPAGAGAGREIPQVGDAEEWQRLASLRKTTSAEWALWTRQAREMYPHGGEPLNAAIRQLAKNTHWKNLPGPARARAPRTRTHFEGMDYSKGL